MSLATRIIPTLLVRNGHLVKGQRFNSWRVVGNAMQAARVHAARSVDELIILDISATPEGRGPNFALVEKLAECCFTPLTVGGGVRTVEDVRRLLRAGADKVAIGTAAYREGFIGACSERFGRQAIVVALDEADGICFSHCGSVLQPVYYVSNAAAHFEREGAGEILLTSIHREGTMTGYDLELIQAVAPIVNIPVIAHGGCSGPEDMLAAVRAGAHAVAAGALFQFTDHTPRSCSEYLSTHGVETRIPA